MKQEPQCSLELLESHEHSGQFRVAGVLNFDSIIKLNQSALDLFLKYNEITVDLSGVTYVNSAGLALLLEWKRLAIMEKKSIHLTGVPQKLINIARISEIENILTLGA